MEHVSASVGSVVAVIVLVAFLFFLQRFWCKKENSNPDSGVSQVIGNQALTSVVSDDLCRGVWRGRVWDYLSLGGTVSRIDV